jgi:hypothetical protein
MNEPRVAIALLQSFGRDDALVGDILEEFERRRSRAWLWRQVILVVLLGLPYGMIRQAGRRKRMPLPIGGLGLVAIVALITIVAPGAWWFVAFGAIGGILLGALLVATRRDRALREGGRRNILLP